MAALCYHCTQQAGDGLKAYLDCMFHHSFSINWHQCVYIAQPCIYTPHGRNSNFAVNVSPPQGVSPWVTPVHTIYNSLCMVHCPCLYVYIRTAVPTSAHGKAAAVAQHLEYLGLKS